MADNIVDQLVIGPSIASPQGEKYRVSDVVAFADGKFSVSYPHSNGAAYTTFIKNGARLFDPKQVQDGPGPHVQSMRCYNIEERLMVTYNLGAWQGIRVLNPAGTNYTMPYRTMTGGYKYSQQMVELGDSQTFGICLNLDNGGTNKWDINCLKYTYNPTTMAQSQQNLGVFHSFRNEEQFIWDFIKVAPNRSILMSFSNGAEAPNYVADGVLLYFAEFSDDTTTWNSKTMTAIPGTTNYKYPRIRATGDGGFLLLAVDTDNNTIQCMRFDSTNTISVPEQTVYGFGKTVNFDISNNVAFAVIVSTKTGEENQLIGIEIDIDTCQRIKDPEIICTDEVENYPALAVNSDEGYVFMGIGYNVKIGVSTYEYRYSEYMIEMSAGTPCANQRCIGCFNSYTCPICVGNDEINREIRQRNEGDCTCIDGYYDNFPTDIDCIKCDDTMCATCNTNPTNCIMVCGEGCSRCEPTGVCKGPTCQNGYLHSSGPPVTCTRCNKKCLNCIGDINTCDGCADSTRDISQNCKCNVGKYSLVIDETCDQTCNYKCLNCAEVNGLCIDCSDSNRDIGDSCNCVDGYYENGVNNPTCGRCDQTVCATCHTNATTCIISCLEGCSSCDLTGACVGSTCKTGFRFDSGNCIKCNSKCLNCSGDNDTCVGCADSTRDSSQNCNCNVGKYSLVLNETCSQNCSHKCEKCEEVNGNCSICSDVNRDQADSCNCKTGYFENGSNNPTCGKCSHKCESCRSENTCDTCSSVTRNLSDNCSCNPGYYNVDEQQDCLQCSDPCGNCTSPTQCTTCKFPATRNPPTCECQPGQFEIVSDCLPCDHTECATCIGSPTNCQQACLEGCILCNALNECEELSPGYFDDGSIALKKCNQNCLKCEDEPNKCTECRIGYYLEDNSCKQCSEKCASCTSFDTCEICSLYKGIGRSQDINNNCECNEGYYSYENTLDCKKCLPQCKNCENGTECNECLNSLVLLPLCMKSKKGFTEIIEENKDLVQIQCSPPCQKCENSKDNCTVCNHGSFRSRNLPCRCYDGYHDENGSEIHCQKCPSLCQFCQNGNFCLECQKEDSVILNSSTGKCECMEGYKLNDNSCKRCYYYLGKCLLECPPNTLNLGQNYICMEKEIMDSQNQILIYLGGFCILFLYGLGSLFNRNSSKKFIKRKQREFRSCEIKVRGNRKENQLQQEQEIENMV